MRRPLVAGLAGRVAIGMTPLSTVLLVRAATGSYAVAGACAAAFTGGAALGAPLRGRVTDARGQPAVLIPCAIAFPAGLVGLVLCAAGDLPAVTLAACTAVAGLAFPPLAACMNLLWASILPSSVVESAYALDAIFEELSFFGAALIVALLVSVTSPTVAVLTAAGLGLGGSAVFAGAPVARAWRSTRAAGPRRWALSVPAVRIVVSQATLSGVSFGALEVGIVAFAEQHATRSAAGVLLAVLSVGSLIGGVWFSSRAATMDAAGVRRHYHGILLFAVAASAPLPFIHAVVPVVPALLAFGFCVAPMVACLYLMLRATAPPEALAEAYAWITTSVFGGAAIGAACAGALAGRSATGALTVVVVASVLAAAMPALLRAPVEPVAPAALRGPDGT